MATKSFKDLKEARKGLKLPGGEASAVYEDMNDDGTDNSSYSWYKRGGYADKVLERLHGSLRRTKWTRTDYKGHAVPDGSFIGGTEYYTKRGWVVSVNVNYGGIKWDNSFSVELKRIES